MSKNKWLYVVFGIIGVNVLAFGYLFIIKAALTLLHLIGIGLLSVAVYLLFPAFYQLIAVLSKRLQKVISTTDPLATLRVEVDRFKAALMERYSKYAEFKGHVDNYEGKVKNTRMSQEMRTAKMATVGKYREALAVLLEALKEMESEYNNLKMQVEELEVEQQFGELENKMADYILRTGDGEVVTTNFKDAAEAIKVRAAQASSKFDVAASRFQDNRKV